MNAVRPNGPGSRVHPSNRTATEIGATLISIPVQIVDNNNFQKPYLVII